MTSAVPPPVNTECGPSLSVTPGATTVALEPTQWHDGEVRHVTRVRSLRVTHPVLLLLRIEVAAGRRERRSVALGRLVHVDRVLSRAQSVDRQRDPHTGGVWREHGGANACAIAPLRFTVTGVACCGAADVVEFVVSARRVEPIAEASRRR